MHLAADDGDSEKDDEAVEGGALASVEQRCDRAPVAALVPESEPHPADAGP